MNKLFVLNGGAAVKQDRLGAMLEVADPKAFFRKDGINTGDVLVYDSILKHLAYDEISNLQFSHAAEKEFWPREEPNATIVRGSNYLSATLDLGHVVPLLKRLKGPIVPMGVGAQSAAFGKLTIPEASAEAWRVIASKCQSIGVRGVYSAEVFNSLGIKNVRVIGCPSFYRSLQPSVKLRDVNRRGLRLGLTLNKYLSGDYASNTVKTRRVQRALLKAVAEDEQSLLYSQGEREESLAVFSSGDEKSALIRSILNCFSLPESPSLLNLLNNRMVAHFDVDVWARDVKMNVDCMVGFRLHGNVMALHQGIPAVFFTYDSRTRELASLFQVPALDIENFEPVNLDQIIGNSNFSEFENAYSANYQEYFLFLEENRLLHRLPASNNGAAVQKSAANRVQQHFTAEQIYAWMLQEVDHLASMHDTLSARAWNLELRVRQLTASSQDDRPTAV